MTQKNNTDIVFNDLTELKSRSRIKNFDTEYENFKKSVHSILTLNPDCTPIFIAITGSTAYGLDLETSDLDGKGVYIQDLESILSEIRMGAKSLSYKDQIGNGLKDESNQKIKEDIVFYELGRIVDLIGTNNPNCIELLSIPDECIVYKHPIWDMLVDLLKANNILTKRCYYTFFNYAEQQIKKATGLNKKINNPIDQVRKTPIDFCHVIFEDNSTMELRKYLDKMKMDQRLCGLVKIPHARDLYSLYYDNVSAESFSKYNDETERNAIRVDKRAKGETMGYGYKGIIKENEKNQEVSNDIRLSSVPKGENRVIIISYNKDGYLTYCKDYTAYWGDSGWLKQRNEERFNDNISSGQNYDGKNMSHCLRLLYMAREISEGKGIIVRRNPEQRDELIEIKKGKWTYDDILKKCEFYTNGLKEMYDSSSLPDEVSLESLATIVKSIRYEYYDI